MSKFSSSFDYINLPDLFYKPVASADFPDASIFALNELLALDLGLDLAGLNGSSGVDWLSGQNQTDDGNAIAMAYAGHQFGHWSGLLGDGRARLVGDVFDRRGARHEVHLKGAGVTPFSRGGDGKATLGSAIREYIVSEAMAALGVPTTRALSIVRTGESVFREQAQPGAIVGRTACSHVRVGTFQYAAAYGSFDDVKALADFTIERLFHEAPSAGNGRYRYLLQMVADRQADLIAKWMLLGFVHGVMNTDNMCISGETIDYGPCAFIDVFHPAKVFSSIDRRGRYAWNKQPELAHWNLTRLAEVLLPLLDDDEAVAQEVAREVLETFSGRFEIVFNQGLADKLALGTYADGNAEIVQQCFGLMTSGRADFTRLFTALTRHAQGETEATVMREFEDATGVDDWLNAWRAATLTEGRVNDDMLTKMKHSNPLVIPRNHRIEEAIEAGNGGDGSVFTQLLEAVTHPFDEVGEFEKYQLAPTSEQLVSKTYCGT